MKYTICISQRAVSWGLKASTKLKHPGVADSKDKIATYTGNIGENFHGSTMIYHPNRRCNKEFA